MKAFRDLPIELKLKRLVVSLGIAVGLSILVSLTIREWFVFHKESEQQLDLLTLMLGAHVAPALMFDDTVSGQQVLEKLDTIPNIISAEIRRADGSVFARYQPHSQQSKERTPAEFLPVPQLSISRPILVDGESYGEVVITGELSAIYHNFWGEALTISGVIVAVLALAFAAFNRLILSIARPLAQLTDMMKRVSAHNDYSMRAQKQGRDEVGILVDGFNTMLTGIEARDRELHKYREHLEEKVAEAQAKMLQSAKLASIGEIAAGLAHELNQPLGAIQLNVEMANLLIERGAENHSGQIATTLQNVVGQIERASKLIRHLRIFGRSSDGEAREPVDINWVVTESLSFFTETFKIRGIECITELSADMPKVECNFIQIQQVLTNLLSNARDAVKNRPLKRITIRSYLAEGCVHLEVEDTGCGMPSDVQASAFLPFYTTKPVGEGTGLGLSISYGILKEHQGGLDIKHSGEAGTCITACLPLCA